MQTDQYYDWPDGRLQRADCGLRIRFTEPADSDGADRRGVTRNTTVTYKGPRQPGQLKIRRQVEFDTDSAAVAELFESLGLINALTFQKRRESWKLDGCCVELDKLPGLGSFVEIEGPSADAITAVSKKLGLADLPIERRPYSQMVCERFKDIDLANEPITF